METSIMGLYRDYIGIMEKKTETTILGLYGDYIGIMEQRKETTIMVLYRDHIGIMELHQPVIQRRPHSGLTNGKAGGLGIYGFRV